MANYKEVRDRLRRPPNAVPDPGINLRKGREPLAVRETAPEPPVRPAVPLSLRDRLVIDSTAFVPFKRTDLTFSSTLEFTAVEFNISIKDIRSRRRHTAFTRPRQIAIWIAARHHVQTLAGIGRYLGMHHTTVMYSRKYIDRLMAEDGRLRQRILNLEAKLLANFPRPAFSCQRKPHLGSESGERHETVRKISSVDSSG